MTKSNLVPKQDEMAKQLYSFRFDPALIREVEKLAKKENRNLTNFIETLLIQKVEESKKSKK